MLSKKKLKQINISALTDYELLALILGFRNKEKITDLSKYLIDSFGLKNIFNLTLSSLIRIKGMSLTKIKRLMAISEIIKRINYTSKKKIKTPEDVYKVVKPLFLNEEQEKLVIITLDRNNHIISIHELFNGSSDKLLIDIKIILKKCILDLAFSLIIVHNHIQSIEPSSHDIKITKRIKRACKLLNINLLDHIIITNSNYFSFKESNLI